jgi:hypothetical protein
VHLAHDAGCDIATHRAAVHLVFSHCDCMPVQMHG